ncbi:hypothetical protein TELCIR_25456 [Teladorsagia circumcincta]|uniref:SCP domain-containing protein n=1 Tax=Teladorsagia circumcincta TaxID=45464 RepID=A0A2G9T5H3_TELCI|nr:hypothetical protein TELCIR_25456 [Teladorsagia circumcincta]
MVWQSSYRLGCGVHSCPHMMFVACEYGPAGNIFDHPIYDVGDPCTTDGDCNDNGDSQTCVGCTCSRDEGLCALPPESTSTTEQPQLTSTTEQPQLTSTTEQPQLTPTTEQPQLTSTTEQPHLTPTTEQPQLTSTTEQPQQQVEEAHGQAAKETQKSMEQQKETLIINQG